MADAGTGRATCCVAAPLAAPVPLSNLNVFIGYLMSKKYSLLFYNFCSEVATVRDIINCFLWNGASKVMVRKIRVTKEIVKMLLLLVSSSLVPNVGTASPSTALNQLQFVEKFNGNGNATIQIFFYKLKVQHYVAVEGYKPRQSVPYQRRQYRRSDSAPSPRYRIYCRTRADEVRVNAKLVYVIQQSTDKLTQNSFLA